LIIDVPIEIRELAYFAGMQGDSVAEHQDIERRHARAGIAEFAGFYPLLNDPFEE
jgi:hypothetical protein